MISVRSEMHLDGPFTILGNGQWIGLGSPFCADAGQGENIFSRRIQERAFEHIYAIVLMCSYRLAIVCIGYSDSKRLLGADERLID
jgi:hypothetical protein